MGCMKLLKRSISNEMALKLSKYFGNSPEIWIGLQNDYDFYDMNLEYRQPCPNVNNYELHRLEVFCNFLSRQYQNPVNP